VQVAAQVQVRMLALDDVHHRAEESGTATIFMDPNEGGRPSNHNLEASRIGPYSSSSSTCGRW